MIRKLLLPVVAVALLGGCMTSGYSYRQDRGDYYYGTPGTDYRYHGSAYGDYGSGYYSRYYGYPGYYRYPYGHSRYPYGYYRNPHGYYRPPVVIRPRPDNDHGGGNRHDDDRKAPWRDYERLQRERIQRMPVSGPTRVAQDRPQPATVRPVAPAPRQSERSSGGSRMESIMKRARQGAVERSRKVEP